MSEGYKEESYNKPFLVTGPSTRKCLCCELEFSVPDSQIHSTFPCKVRKPNEPLSQKDAHRRRQQVLALSRGEA